jgi:hypothetical protein
MIITWSSLCLNHNSQSVKLSILPIMRFKFIPLYLLYCYLVHATIYYCISYLNNPLNSLPS